jgi:hypothetical protein
MTDEEKLEHNDIVATLMAQRNAAQNETHLSDHNGKRILPRHRQAPVHGGLRARTAWELA